MIAVLAAELLKLRRSLVLLVTLAAPVCVSAFAAAALATRSGTVGWERFLDEGLAMWSFFMLPMSVTALTMLLAQLEHNSRMWTHLLALPVPRASLFLSKMLVAILLLLAMQMLVYGGLYAAGLAVDVVLGGGKLTGDMQTGEMAVGLVAMAIGTLPMLAIQLWVALASRSFVTPLVVGILGTFFALVVTAAGVRLYIPWLLQIWATMWPRDAGVIGVTAGLIGGLILIAAMVATMSRRELA